MSENSEQRPARAAQQVFTAGEWSVAVDRDGDIALSLVHRCGCCRTIGAFAPAHIDELVKALRFAQATGTARKAGATPETGGRA